MLERRVIAAAVEAREGDCPGAALAAFWGALGRRVVEMVGMLWVQYRTPFYMSVPYHVRIDIDPAALAIAMRACRVVGARHPTATAPGWPCGLFECQTRDYSLERVEVRHRKQVQKGLERCEIREVDPDLLLVEGLELNQETLARQGRLDPEFGEVVGWQRVVTAIRRTPAVNVTGAFLDGRLSAYAILCRDGGWLHLLYKMTRTDDMIHRTNPALDFAILAAASRDPSLVGVTNSWLSLTRGSEGLHRYKQLMGYRVVHHALAVHLHPALAPVLTTRPVVRAAAALARLRPRTRTLELAAHVLAGARATRQRGRERLPASAGA